MQLNKNSAIKALRIIIFLKNKYLKYHKSGILQIEKFINTISMV